MTHFAAYFLELFHYLIDACVSFFKALSETSCGFVIDGRSATRKSAFDVGQSLAEHGVEFEHTQLRYSLVQLHQLKHGVYSIWYGIKIEMFGQQQL